MKPFSRDLVICDLPACTYVQYKFSFCQLLKCKYGFFIKIDVNLTLNKMICTYFVSEWDANFEKQGKWTSLRFHYCLFT